MDLQNSILLAIEKTWIAQGVFFYWNLGLKFRENRYLYILLSLVSIADYSLWNYYLTGAHYSGSAILISLLNSIVSISFLIKLKHKNPYILLLIITVLECFSFVSRVLIR